MLCMNRPCFLVIDREFPGSVSTRKLVIETAKFNVLTAYSGKEALEIFTTFPGRNGSTAIFITPNGARCLYCANHVAPKPNSTTLASAHPTAARANPLFKGSPPARAGSFFAPKPTISSNRLIRPSCLRFFAA